MCLRCWKWDFFSKKKLLIPRSQLARKWSEKNHFSTLILFEISCSRSTLYEIFIHFSTPADRKHEMILCVLEPKAKAEKEEEQAETVQWRRCFSDGWEFAVRRERSWLRETKVKQISRSFQVSFCDYYCLSHLPPPLNISREEISHLFPAHSSIILFCRLQKVV